MSTRARPRVAPRRPEHLLRRPAQTTEAATSPPGLAGPKLGNSAIAGLAVDGAAGATVRSDPRAAVTQVGTPGLSNHAVARYASRDTRRDNGPSLARQGHPVTTPGAPPQGENGLKSDVDKFLSRRVRFKIPDRKLFDKHAGREFGWSTAKDAAAPKPIVLGAGTVPLPEPVGPLELRLEANARAWAGGHANVDLWLRNIWLEADMIDLWKAGIAIRHLPILPLPSLLLLGSIILPGHAKLEATANAGLNAGAAAEITAVANPVVWPVEGWVGGGLGIGGNLNARAEFFGDVDVEFQAGFLRVRGFAQGAQAGLTAGLGLQGHLAAGINLGYSVAKTRHELWRRTFALGPTFDVSQAVEGGHKAHMRMASDDTPEVDLEQVSFLVERLVQLLLDGSPKNDNIKPLPPGQAPAGQPPAVLELPAAKAHHLGRYRSLLGRLHHTPGTERRTDQVSRWNRNVLAELHDDVIERAIDLGVLDEPGDEERPPDRNELFRRGRGSDSPVVRPYWSRSRQYATAMGVDHVVEWQVYPNSAVDEPWNFELLDPSVNSSVGPALQASIDRTRARMGPGWQDKMIVFTDVVVGGGRPAGDTWSHEEILAGRHLDAWDSFPHPPRRRRRE